jgi:hypothetical protein
MAEEGLHIDTQGESTSGAQPIGHEHGSEEVDQHSVADNAVDPETSSSEETEDSISGDSDKIVQDLSPTTTIQPEHHEHDVEKDEESPSQAEPTDHETSAKESSEEPSLTEETGTKDEDVDEERVQETSAATNMEPENSREEPMQDLEAPEPVEGQDQSLPEPVETKEPFEDAPPHDSTAITPVPESSIVEAE